jgi:hypothetical protein
LALTIVSWLWVVAGTGVVLGIAYFVIKDGLDQPDVALVTTLVLLVATGAVVSSLRTLDLVTPSLWSWRVAAGAISIGAILVAVTQPPVRLVAVAASALYAGLFAASFVAGPALEAPPSGAPAAPPAALTIDGVRLWHGVALFILAAGTTVFLALFVRMIERGVSPQIETHWGGIGGGLGGWRISLSLTYLLAAAVFGVLFAFFVLQLEAPSRQPAQANEAAVPSSAPASGPGET